MEVAKYKKYDIAFCRNHGAVKKREDVGKLPPCLSRRYDYTECFALEYLIQSDEYKEIELHDRQAKGADGLDLIVRDRQLGIEVTQAINEAFRKEGMKWNKPLSNANNDEVSDDALFHKWKNQPLRFEDIAKVIKNKNEKYQEYLKKWKSEVRDIDLFVYVADAKIKDTNIKFLEGCLAPEGMGWTPSQYIGIGLTELLNDLRTPYRKVYNHGVRVKEQATSLVAPVTGTAGLQVIIGTAPVNLAADPYKATNVPMIAYSFSEAVEQVGYSDDFKNYTLCQSMDACFRVLNVAPIILINVLDPKKHKKANEEQTVNVEKMQATVKVAGILADTVEVKANEATLTAGTDYITTFDDDGYLVITLTAGGKGASAKTLTVNSTSIDPTAVTESDIIGGYNASTGAETGMELIRHIYPKFSMTPGLLLAPGWTQKPNVGIALAAKCEEINGVFTCECILDIDTAEATKYTDCNDWKNKNGYTNKHAALLWPQVKVGTKQYAYSAIFGALTAYTDASNDDVPNLSPSNKLIGITGLCLEDGTEVTLDQPQANLLNGQGIITAINDSGWKSWGNNTACYPANTDPKDRWFCCRRFFSWWGNSFILTYKQKVDEPGNYRLIESIVDSENIRGNSYVSQGKCAGARIEFSEDENPVTDILNGKIQFHQYLAPYVPAEDILNILEFDPDMLSAALNGGE